MSLKSVGRITPALLISTSMSTSNNRPARSVSDSLSVTSTPASTRTPSASSSRDDCRQTATRLSPRSRYCRVSARPMPRLAPVITILLMSGLAVETVSDCTKTGPILHRCGTRPGAARSSGLGDPSSQDIETVGHREAVGADQPDAERKAGKHQHPADGTAVEFLG